MPTLGHNRNMANQTYIPFRYKRIKEEQKTQQFFCFMLLYTYTNIIVIINFQPITQILNTGLITWWFSTVMTLTCDTVLLWLRTYIFFLVIKPVL